jgi:trans-o-hydroxybenzylidenepyruvate hydratase-aldolase
MLKLSAKDIKGVMSFCPTPSTPRGDRTDETNSVDLDTSAKLFNMMIASGVGGFALCGTTGECAALLWEEKKEFITTGVDVVKKRVPLFAGATALGTKETIRQMREFQKIGADGAFVGLPLWQTPTIENIGHWYKDLAEACPDMPVMIYSNAMFFKSTFPLEFWEQVGRYGKTVVTNKIAYSMDHLEQDIKATMDRVQFIPGASGAIAAYRKVGDKIQGLWTTDPMPEPYVALSDAIQHKDEKRIAEVEADIKSLPPRPPSGGPGFAVEFPMYNVQAVRERWNTSDYLHVGPARPPYRDLPDHWAKPTAVYMKGWQEMRKKYINVAARRS